MFVMTSKHACGVLCFLAVGIAAAPVCTEINDDACDPTDAVSLLQSTIIFDEGEQQQGLTKAAGDRKAQQKCKCRGDTSCGSGSDDWCYVEAEGSCSDEVSGTGGYWSKQACSQAEKCTEGWQPAAFGFINNDMNIKQSSLPLSLDGCIKLCKETDGCVAFSFQKKEIESICYLKSSLSPRSSFAGNAWAVAWQTYVVKCPEAAAALLDAAALHQASAPAAALHQDGGYDDYGDGGDDDYGACVDEAGWTDHEFGDGTSGCADGDKGGFLANPQWCIGKTHASKEARRACPLSCGLCSQATCIADFVDQDLEGTDVSQVVATGSTSAELDGSCCNQCNADGNCEFWVRLDSQCWLKRDAGAYTESSGFTGGHKQA